MPYWVGGDGTWTNGDSNQWSLTSGGTPGAGQFSSDDVIFDNNSFNGFTSLTVTIDDDVSFGGFDCTQITNPGLSLNFVLNSGSLTPKTFIKLPQLTDTVVDITSVGAIYVKVTNAAVSTGIVMTVGGLGDVFPYISVDSGEKLIIDGTASTGVFQEISVGDVGGSAILDIEADIRTHSLLLTGQSSVANISSGTTLYLTGNPNALDMNLNTSISGGNVVFEPQTANMDIDILSGATLTCQSIKMKPLISGTTFNFTGSGGTFSDIEKDLSGISIGKSMTLNFESGSTYNFTDWNLSGTSVSNIITLQSSSPGVQTSITKATPGFTTTNYMTVQDISASPDFTWVSYNSTDNGNNTQWYFDGIELPKSSLFFGSHT